MKKDKKNNKNKRQQILWMILCVVLAAVCFAEVIVYNRLVNEQQTKIETMDYNDFLAAANKHEIYQITYSPNEEWMTVILYNDMTRGLSEEALETYSFEQSDMRRVQYPASVDFREQMLKLGIHLVYKDAQSVAGNALNAASILINLVFPIVLIVVMMKAYSSQMGGSSFLSDSKEKSNKSTTKFSDVIGQDEIIDDIQLITKLVKDPSYGEEIGANPPKGILLTGNPGVGKTLIAKAIAGEANVPLINVNGSDFNEIFVGMGAKRVRDLFKRAREQAPCIVFIDEIDAIGQKRDERGSNRESDNTLDALLKELDGFTGRDGVFVLAATNHPDKLDNALKRAGRFDRQINVRPPKNWKVRLELLEHYAKNYKLAEDVDLAAIAKTMSGFTGADIAMICNESALVALMHDKKYIDHACMEEAIDKIMFHGNRSKREEYKEDKIVTAYHEAGHAVMTYLENQPIARASIISTTSGVGGAVFGADTESCFVTDKEMLGRVRIAYAGRASEEIQFKDVTTGASNDITQATKYLVAYLERYGFDKSFGMLDMQVLNKQNLLNSDHITTKLSDLSKQLYEETLRALKENFALVEALAQKLLEVETLNGEDIVALFEETEPLCEPVKCPNPALNKEEQ